MGRVSFSSSQLHGLTAFPRAAPTNNSGQVGSLSHSDPNVFPHILHLLISGTKDYPDHKHKTRLYTNPWKPCLQAGAAMPAFFCSCWVLCVSQFLVTGETFHPNSLLIFLLSSHSSHTCLTLLLLFYSRFPFFWGALCQYLSFKGRKGGRLPTMQGILTFFTLQMRKSSLVRLISLSEDSVLC